MNMMMQHRIKEIPGLQFVADSMEFMSGIGRRRMMEQPFLTQTEQLLAEQNYVEAMRQALSRKANTSALTTLRHQLMQLHDIRTTLHSLQSHFLLSEVELFEIKSLSYHAKHAAEALRQMDLSSLFPLPDLTRVFSLLDPDHTGIPNFYIYDSYDPQLTTLRQQMKQADEQQMALLIAQQNEVQQHVITHLCDLLQPFAQTLEQTLEQMAYLDFTLARATLSEQWGLTKPLYDKGEYFFANLFNPRLRKHNEDNGLRYQPVDISLTSGTTLITGANMAGKTVLLKSVGVAQLMYQYGFPVPATDARIEPVDDVVFCIGDEQNEMNGLSSFAAEITRISDLLHRSEQEHLLILIDEPARTTNPVEGKALVQALTDMLKQRNSITLITTHYSQLGIPCRRLRVKGFVENLVDTPLTATNINRFIDYSLINDDSDEVPHEALRIAEMLECHPNLITQARKYLK